MRILHVREPDYGGVQVVVDQYVAASPQLEHAILRVGHRDSFLVADSRAEGTGSGVGAGVMAVRRAIALVRPDIVHAHSSWAGLYVRLAAPRRTRIVYTPHCFAFERLDVARPVRSIFRWMERALLPRTSVVAGASEREVALAAELRGRRSAPELALLPHAAPSPSSVRSEARRPMTVVSLGRGCPQKRPDLFGELARAAGAAGLEARFRWLGDGPDAARDELERAGVEVSGWLDPNGVRDALAASDAYVHVADWEVGDPLATIEAAAAGVPVLSRRTPSTSHSRVGDLFAEVADAATWLVELDDSAVYAQRSSAALAEAAKFPPDAQAAALERIYRLAAPQLTASRSPH